MSRLKKVALGVAGVLVAAAVALAVAVAALDEPMPRGVEGPEAEALADRMLEAVRADRWAETGAVRWTFRGAHEHLWDRDRNLARVRWGDVEVLVDVATRRGVATRGGEPVSGAEADALVEKAWAFWANDSFWLNPVVKVRDEGTTRELVTLEGGAEALLVRYSSGGVTPGDAYLWLLDEDGTPRAWRMWVQIIPVGGLEFTWEGWRELPTGARVATRHGGLLSIDLTGVEAAATLAELVPGEDPFAPLVE